MNRKIITILLVIMMNMVIIPAMSSPTTELIKPEEKPPEPSEIQIMVFSVIEISGDGQILSLPGFLFWSIDSGNIKITYLGGEYTATSGRGIFIMHLGSKSEDPVSITGVASIGIIF